MKKAIWIFVILLVMAVTCYAEEAKKPDTIFQKVREYTEGGYKKDVQPIKQMTLFQIMANWVNGSSEEKPGK